MFVHLRLHTEYSLTDGIVRVEPPKRKGGGQGATLGSRAAELKLPAVAVTDTNNLFAMVKFYKAAEAKGVKPLIGADVWLEEAVRGESPERLTLLVQNQLGYRHLTELISRSYTEGQERGQPLVKREWLRELCGGLIALSGRDGGIFRAAAADHVDAALTGVEAFRALFGDCFYLEISRCQREGDEEWVRAAVALARRCQVPVVATNDVRFLNRQDFDAHEARVCIAQGRVINDPKRPRDYTPEQYLKSAEEMTALFADIPEALENTVEIARRCTLALKFAPPYHLPDFPVPDGHSADSWLRERARAGLEERLREIQPARPPDQYRQRLDYELNVIEKMGFAGYFLVVSDFIQWAKTNGCPVGPGRGSGAGSLVAYAIRITDLDPLPYDLLFERFLNPERVSLPDFDVDFCMDNRDRVIAYVSQKYGREHVGQIITYSTMAAKGVIRDVARVLGQSYGFGDALAKLVPFTPGATLVDALETVPELKSRYQNEEDTRALLDLALELEGITRGVGVHAGGVVIAPKSLTDYAPLFCEPGGAGLRTQFDMKDLEAVGLVKFDFLGLKTLTIIQTAAEMLAQKGQPLDILKLPLDDQATYRLYASGDTTAVFQMESPGMQRAARDLKPSSFEDIIALVSLYRPGPMELIPEYCARKRGDLKVEYLHPDMEPVLSATYGVFVYQEQVMQMSQRLAGYTLGGADLLRRAMGKKIASEMQKQRAVFTEGAIKRGVTPEAAGQVFDLMEKFANYGFNKSHAAAYALVSYQTAWLKTHYPAEFMAAVLSCEMQHTDTVVTMLDECRRMGLKVHAPDINQSRFRFTVPAPGEIHYGLGAIRGVGEGALEGILRARDQGGAFTDLFDFCARVDLKKANKRACEALIFSGALDGFGLNRASLLATLPLAIQVAERAQESRSSGQNDMFGLGSGAAAQAPTVEPVRERDWPLAQRLEKEKEALGFYLSGHPIEAHREMISQVCSGNLLELTSAAQNQAPPPRTADGKPVWQPRQKSMFAAWVTDIRFFKADASREGRAGRASYKVAFDDRTAQVSAWIDADQWSRWQDTVKSDTLAFVIAEVGMAPQREGREPEARLYNPEFLATATVMADYAHRLSLHWQRPASEVPALQKLLLPYRHPKGVPVTLNLVNEQATATVDLPADWRIRVDEACLNALRHWLGPDCVKVLYRKYLPPVVERRFERSTAGGNGFDDE
jgi:DNA polymerase III subunit alpha